ncbi:MAG: hypothetical protein ACWGO1_12075, partial [Anaerolineales bacterium]
MNWALSISERLQPQKALKKFSTSGTPWISGICQGAALIVLTIIPFVAYSGITQPPGISIPAPPNTLFSSLLGHAAFQAAGDAMITALAMLPYAFILYSLGWIYFFSGVWITLQGQKEDAGQALVILCSAAAVTLASIVSLPTSGRLTWLVGISMAVVGGSLIAFALLYPNKEQRLAQKNTMLWIGVLPGIILCLLWLFLTEGIDRSGVTTRVWIVEFVYLGIAALTLLGVLIYHLIRSESKITQQRARRIVVGLGLTLLPICLGFLFTRVVPGYQVTATMLIPLAVFPIVTSYNLQPGQSEKSNINLQITLTYALLSALVVSAYFLMVSGLSLLLGERIAGDNPLLIALMVFVLSVSLNPARNRIQAKVEQFFQRNHIDSKTRAQALV